MFHLPSIVSLMARKGKPLPVSDILTHLELPDHHRGELVDWFKQHNTYFRQIGSDLNCYGLASWAGYIAAYAGKTIELYAMSLYNAKVQAEAQFKVHARYKHLISVVLCERPDGTSVIHSLV